MYNEEEIIHGCIKGDAKNQHLLYGHFAKKMLVVCMRYTKNRMEAEDILQEGFIKVFNNIGSFRKECPLEHWIKRIMVNTALKHIRGKVFIFPEDDKTVLENYSGKEEIILSDYGFHDLLNMIQQLPPGYQAVFNLFAIEGYSHKEISEMLEITEGTSKSQYSKAKSKLQDMILKNSQMVENIKYK